MCCVIPSDFYFCRQYKHARRAMIWRFQKPDDGRRETVDDFFPPFRNRQNARRSETTRRHSHLAWKNTITQQLPSIVRSKFVLSSGRTWIPFGTSSHPVVAAASRSAAAVIAANVAETSNIESCVQFSDFRHWVFLYFRPRGVVGFFSFDYDSKHVLFFALG